MSSYQPADLTGLVAGLDPRPAHVVVRLYLPEEQPPQAHSLAQIESARRAGCSVGGYLWAYGDLDPRQSVRAACSLASRAQLTLPVLWMDCEGYGADPGPDAAWLRAALDECERLGVRGGIYTGRWWAERRLPAGEFARVPLWAAWYNGRADLDSVPLFAAWRREMLWGHQYVGEGLDLDVFDARALGG